VNKCVQLTPRSVQHISLQLQLRSAGHSQEHMILKVMGFKDLNVPLRRRISFKLSHNSLENVKELIPKILLPTSIQHILILLM
jgi:hypothetical protein